MSVRYPIIAVTGSSGAGTTTVQHAFENLFRRHALHAAIVNGDSFHRYTREEMAEIISRPETDKSSFNHFGLQANLITELQELFSEYGATGRGTSRRYVHDENQQDIENGYPSGTFTPWETLPSDTDLLFYEGLHGGLVAGPVNLAQHVDLLLGVAPIINLEWMQKVHRDTHDRGYSREAVVNTILGRMDDYVHYILPQFSRTHINFQRVPTVDTCNPFEPRASGPSDEDSLIVISFRQPHRFDLNRLAEELGTAMVSRQDNLVIPGPDMGRGLEVIVGPVVEELVSQARADRAS